MLASASATFDAKRMTAMPAVRDAVEFDGVDRRAGRFDKNSQIIRNRHCSSLKRYASLGPSPRALFATYTRSLSHSPIGVLPDRNRQDRSIIFRAVKRAAIILLIIAAVPAVAETPARLYGYTEEEIQQVMAGAILSKELKEASEKELAGVVAVFFHKPVAEIAGTLLEGKNLKFDKTIHDLRVWKPDQPVPDLPRDLNAHYEAYRKGGLTGVGKRGEELTLAVKALPAERWGEISKALLRYPSDTPRDMEQRFFFYRQEVDGQPTFILSHRCRKQGEHGALVTEQRYHVSRTYDCRFIASDCVEVPGGTLVFYVNCLFTDQVAGMGSRVKHNIGRKRMLADVAASLKDLRAKLEAKQNS